MEKRISQKTAQQIVDTVKDVCGQNINFIDENGIICASTDCSRLGQFHEIGKQVILSGNTIEVERDDTFYGTHQGVNIPVSHEGRILAVIGISGKPSKVRKYAYLAQKITSLLLREHDLDMQRNSKKNQLNYIIRALIHKEDTKQAPVQDFLSEYHIVSTDTYRTILVQMNSRYNPSNLHMIEQHIFQSFEVAGSSLYTFEYPNDYILLLREDSYQKQSHVFARLAGSYPELLHIAIGSSQTILEQNRSYEDAQLALHAPENPALYDALTLELLLSNLDASIRTRYTEKILSHLTQEDKHLLQVYYANGMSLTATSVQLYLHKNTLQYQLDRIQKRSGYNPRSFQDAVLFHTALALESYH